MEWVQVRKGVVGGHWKREREVWGGWEQGMRNSVTECQGHSFLRKGSQNRKCGSGVIPPGFGISVLNTGKKCKDAKKHSRRNRSKKQGKNHPLLLRREGEINASVSLRKYEKKQTVLCCSRNWAGPGQLGKVNDDSILN